MRCSQKFCFDHFRDHQIELQKEFDQIEIECDLFRQAFTKQIDNGQQHSAIEQINRWEQNSIQLIQHIAEQARQSMFGRTAERRKKIEEDLTRLTNQLCENREDVCFVETDLRCWKRELDKLTDQLNQSLNVLIEYNSTPLINKLVLNLSGYYFYFLNFQR